MSVKNRLHALDALRAFALLLGIAYHGAAAYVPGVAGWAIADGSSSAMLGWLYYVIHVFRLPTFFLMAGVFAHLAFHRHGPAGFLRDRIKRILVPLVIGWILLYPLIVGVWIWGGLRSGGGALAPEARGLSVWKLTAVAFRTGEAFRNGISLAHLWFLYYLLMLYGIVLLVRAVVVTWLDRDGRLRLRIDGGLRALLRRRWAPAVLAIPVAASLYWGEGSFGVHSPDTSLVPEPSALVAYGTFLCAGWLLHRQMDLLRTWADRWRSSLALAVLLSVLVSGVYVRLPVALGGASRGLRACYAAGYATAMWLWVIAVTGLFLRFFSRPSAARRYVADSSYWLYLIHLPLVAFLQVAMARAPWYWGAKFSLVLAVSTPLLLVSYHWLVRFTLIGAVLNGRREMRPSGAKDDSLPSAEDQGRAQSHTGCLGVAQPANRRAGAAGRTENPRK